MRIKPVDLFVLVGFLVLISIPLVGSFFSPEGSFEAGSVFTDGLSLPQMVRGALAYPSEFSQHFQNHYFTHQWQVDLFHAFRYHILGETSFPNVVIGKEDWLYYSGESNLDDYQCASPFTDNEVETIRTRLENWDQQLKERGIQFYVVIAPNKESIYPQFLPDQVRVLPRACRIDQVMQAMQASPVRVLDLRAGMHTAAQASQAYHRTDTHWNAYGALQASAEILSLLHQNFPQITIPALADYQQASEDFSGDLAAFLPGDDRFVEQAIQLDPIHSSGVEIRQGENRTIFASIEGSDLPSAVVFRDSFTDALVPFLSDHFSWVTYVFSFQVEMELVEAEKPDIVILEIAQRYLTALR